MRDQFWDFMYRIKYYELFARHNRTWISRLDIGLSILLAVIGSGSITAWKVWSSLPILWAVLLMVSQLLQIARPYLPFASRVQAFRFYIPELSTLFTDVLDAWNRCKDFDSTSCTDQLHDLRKRLDTLDNRYFGSESLSASKRLAQKLSDECDRFFVSL